MPGGDGTGPAGMGPMTGRAAGYCVGYAVPGFMNPIPGRRFWGAGYALWGRIKKGIQAHRFSHASDWIFPALLFAVALSGIMIHTFRYLGMPLATYYTYIVHLAITAPMLILEVPFGKWSHLYYRPLAIYFQKVKERASGQRDLAAAGLAAAD